MDQLIKEYIILPMAIKSMRHDRELIKGRNMLNVYWSKIDHVIEQMQGDHNEVKRKLIVEHRTQVKGYKNGDKRVYVAGDKTYEYTPDDLREMTKKIIDRYMVGDRESKFEVGWYPENAETDQHFIRDFTNRDLK